MMSYFSRTLSFTLLLAITLNPSFAAGSGWVSKLFKPKSVNPCEASFASFLNHKLPAQIIDTPTMNMWDPRFNATDFVDEFNKSLFTKKEKIKALEDIKTLVSKDQDLVNSIADISNELVARKVLTRKEIKSILLDNTDTNIVRFYFSNTTKKFIGKIEVNVDKKSFVEQFLSSQDISKSLKKEYSEILMFSSRTVEEFEYAVSKGFKLRNDKKSLNQLREYLDFLDLAKESSIKTRAPRESWNPFKKLNDYIDTKKFKHRKKAFNNIDEIYDFNYKHNAISYSSSSLLNPRKRFLIQKSRVKSYEGRRLKQIEKKLAETNSGKALSKQHKSRALRQAKGESLVFGRLLNGCNGKGGKTLKSAAKKFSKFKLSLALTATPAFYYAKNKDKLDKKSDSFDRYWFERLGYEMGLSLIFTAVGNKIFTSTSTNFWGKYLKGYVNFGALDAISAYGYDTMFGSKGYGAIMQQLYRSDLPGEKATPLETKYDEIVKSPTFDKDIKEMYAFLEERSKDINLKNKLNKHFNLYTYKSGDDKDRITQEDLETEEGREVLMELLAERMYAENMGQWEAFQSGNTGADRWLFYRARNSFWDIKGLVSNLAIFQIMCRIPLGKASWGLILGIVVANEMLSGPTYEYRREAINQ